jgi:hypothetical protein
MDITSTGMIMTRSTCMVEKRAEPTFGLSQCLFFTTLMHIIPGNSLFCDYPGINEAVPTPMDRMNLLRPSTPQHAPSIDAARSNLWSTG